MLNPKFAEHYKERKKMEDERDWASERDDQEAYNNAWKAIEEVDKKVAAEGKDYQDLFLALRWAWSSGEKYLDICDQIRVSDVPKMVKRFRKYGIDRFTISCRYTCLNIIWEFLQNGCELEGMTEVVTYIEPVTKIPRKGPAYVLSVH